MAEGMAGLTCVMARNLSNYLTLQKGSSVNTINVIKDVAKADKSLL